MKTYNKILTIAVLFSSMISCTSVLDKEKLDSINPGDVWNNEKMIDAVMNDIHGSLMPGWAYDGHLSDEAPDHRAGMNTFLRGKMWKRLPLKTKKQLGEGKPYSGELGATSAW